MTTSVEQPIVLDNARTDSPATAYAQFRARRRFASLDGIRGLSVLAVVYHHSGPVTSWFPATRTGFLGVGMFFMLSGFLIVTLLLRERDSHGAISLRRFYVRRACRILPPLLGMLAALAAFYSFRRGDIQAEKFFERLPYYLTFTANFCGSHAANLAILWSLAAEEQFYLVWPALERYLPRRGVRWLLAGLLAVNLAAFVWGAGVSFRGPFGELNDDVRTVQITYFPIVLGVILAHLLHSESGFHAARRWLPRSAAAIGAAAILLLANALGLVTHDRDADAALRMAIQAAMLLFFAGTIVHEECSTVRALAWRPLARLGVISYGVYLYHMWGIDAARRVLGMPGETTSVAIFALGLATTAMIAEASFRWFETPFLRLKTPYSR